MKGWLYNMADINTPYYEIYKLIPDDFNSIKVDDLNFSNRLRNRLLAINVFRVSDLLRISEADLRKIQGLGKNSYDEIERYCRELKKEINVSKTDKSSDVVGRNEIFEFSSEG